ncbi:MAG TPA: flagellar protein FlgN [Chthonomonadales bacterium]|nr:flagellar protein FlgN [Chthonomonadales bacterium]
MSRQLGQCGEAPRFARVLASALERQAAVGAALAAVAEEQTAALVRHDMDAFLATQKRIEQLAREQERSERARIQAAGRLAAVLGVQAEAPRLSQLLQACPPEERARLAALRDRLLALRDAIERAGERNRVLLENARTCTQESLDLLMRMATAPERYGVGMNAGATATVYVDRRA